MAAPQVKRVLNTISHCYVDLSRRRLDATGRPMCPYSAVEFEARVIPSAWGCKAACWPGHIAFHSDRDVKRYAGRTDRSAIAVRFAVPGTSWRYLPLLLAAAGTIGC